MILRLGLAFLAALPVAVGVPGTGAHMATVPKYGGTLVVGTSRSSGPDSLDPTVAGSGTSGEIFRSICERLYDYDAKLRPVPVLAASLPVIAYDAPGPPAMLAPEHLVPIGAAREMASKVLAMLADPARLSLERARAAARARDFAWPTVARLTSDVYSGRVASLAARCRAP